MAGNPFKARRHPRGVVAVPLVPPLILTTNINSCDVESFRTTTYKIPRLISLSEEEQKSRDFRDSYASDTPHHFERPKMSTITKQALQTSYPPTLPNDFNGNQPKTIRLYPLSNYTFGTKETQAEEDPSVVARLNRLEDHYKLHGMRRTCEGILVCHEHNHPHILMLQIANAFFKLPGDYLHEEDEEIEGFKKRLNERLAPVGGQFSGEGVNGDWEIGDTLAQWWRPNFETFMYPFIPAHVTRPKECKKLYFIQLPRQKVLSVPKNMKLLAVPLFELYDNTARYGPQLSAIPHLLSRYNFEFVDENGKVVACTPGGDGGDGTYAPRTMVLAGGEGDEEMKEGGGIQ